MNNKKDPTISVDKLLEELKNYKNKGYEITFSGLRFLRVKERGEKLLQVEFNETVYLSSQGDVVVENH